MRNPALALVAILATLYICAASDRRRVSLITYIDSPRRMLARELTSDSADPRALTLMKKKAHSICRMIQCYVLLDAGSESRALQTERQPTRTGARRALGRR